MFVLNSWCLVRPIVVSWKYDEKMLATFFYLNLNTKAKFIFLIRYNIILKTNVSKMIYRVRLLTVVAHIDHSEKTCPDT